MMEKLGSRMNIKMLIMKENIMCGNHTSIQNTSITNPLASVLIVSAQSYSLAYLWLKKNNAKQFSSVCCMNRKGRNSLSTHTKRGQNTPMQSDATALP